MVCALKMLLEQPRKCLGLQLEAQLESIFWQVKSARGYLFSVALKLIPDTELGAASHERCVWIQHDLAGVPAVTAFPAALSVYSEAI